MGEPAKNQAAADAISFGVGAVARYLGVAPATLRTWDRRYGLGPAERTAGSHRRYAPSDIERLAIMRRLTAAGVPAAEAAKIARESDVDSVDMGSIEELGQLLPIPQAAESDPATQSGIGVTVLPGAATEQLLEAVRKLAPTVVVLVVDQREGNCDAVSALQAASDSPLTFLVRISPVDMPIPPG